MSAPVIAERPEQPAEVNTQNRAFVGCKMPGDMHGPGMVITGNYRLKRDAEINAHAANEGFEGYLLGRWVRGWITWRSATAEETEKFKRENPIPQADNHTPTAKAE